MSEWHAFVVDNFVWRTRTGSKWHARWLETRSTVCGRRLDSDRSVRALAAVEGDEMVYDNYCQSCMSSVFVIQAGPHPTLEAL